MSSDGKRWGRRGVMLAAVAALALAASGCSSSSSTSGGAVGTAADPGKASTVSYKVSCPGASQSDWTFTVTGTATGPSWQQNPQLTAAVRGYAGYVKQNTAELVSHTQTFCQAIDAGNLNQAKVLYPRARAYYERIEPVAAMAVVNLLQPYLRHKDPGALAQIKQRNDAVTGLLAHYQADPGYDRTGYVDYSTVEKAERRQLSTAVNALAEAMSKLSAQVSG